MQNVPTCDKRSLQLSILRKRGSQISKRYSSWQHWWLPAFRAWTPEVGHPDPNPGVVLWECVTPASPLAIVYLTWLFCKQRRALEQWSSSVRLGRKKHLKNLGYYSTVVLSLLKKLQLKTFPWPKSSNVEVLHSWFSGNSWHPNQPWCFLKCGAGTWEVNLHQVSCCFLFIFREKLKTAGPGVTRFMQK